MGQDIELNLADKLEFRLNHKKCYIESSSPNICLEYRGGTTEPYICFFTLHWEKRTIPVRTKMNEKTFGKNNEEQWIKEVQRTVEQNGHPDFAARKPMAAYKFQSREEQICAANLIVRALTVFGGSANKPKWKCFPEYRRISAELSRADSDHTAPYPASAR
jgi:hypothetical protein